MASCSQVNSLFQAFIDDELGHAEKSILEQHMSECARCRAELGEQKACTARVFEALSEHRLSWGMRSRVLAHLPEMDPPLHGGSHPTDPQYAVKKPRHRYSWSLAVAALVLVSVSLFLYSRAESVRDVLLPVGMVTYSGESGVLRKSPQAREFETVALKSLVGARDELETLSNGRLAIALIGGSTVKANYNSSLIVLDHRRVAVEQGQTYFDIGRDRRHFYVDTPAGEILVFGTAFLVDATATATTVTVTEGDIIVSNRVGKMAVSRGKQLVFKNNEPMGTPYPVDIAPLIAWADAIVPDPEALALFQQTLELRRQHSAIPAEPVYAARNPENIAISEVHVSWNFDGQTSGHCGYIIHASDGQGNLILLDTLDSSLFNSPLRDQVEIPLPQGPIENLDVIHIRLIPDYTSGSTETVMEVRVAE